MRSSFWKESLFVVLEVGYWVRTTACFENILDALFHSYPEGGCHTLTSCALTLFGKGVLLPWYAHFIALITKAKIICFLVTMMWPLSGMILASAGGPGRHVLWGKKIVKQKDAYLMLSWGKNLKISARKMPENFSKFFEKMFLAGMRLNMSIGKLLRLYLF